MPGSLGNARDDGTDEHFMRVALDLARHGRGRVEPNPMVGCVIVRDGAEIGRGFHREFGGPHAEVDAIASLHSATDAKHATAYVSLEPCCHHGKTPPCSKALIDAGIARVVVAMADPFSRVDGGGIRQLQHAGIETTVGLLAAEAESLNAPYLKKVRTGKPWVIAKWAMTVDGRIATASGESRWITGQTARDEVHQLRSRVDAVAVGMGTVVADDPMLTARLGAKHSPARVATRVVFCRNRIPSVESNLVRTAQDIPLMVVVGPKVRADERSQLESKGAAIVNTDSDEPAEMVAAALDKMGRQEMTNVMLEGGGELLASFFFANQIDECHVYIGAKAVGGRDAPGPIGGRGVHEIARARRLKLVSVDQFDDDLRVVYRRAEE